MVNVTVTKNGIFEKEEVPSAIEMTFSPLIEDFVVLHGDSSNPWVRA